MRNSQTLLTLPRDYFFGQEMSNFKLGFGKPGGVGITSGDNHVLVSPVPPSLPKDLNRKVVGSQRNPLRSDYF